MSIIGLFTQSRPNIGELYFDGVLEESSELVTEASEFPIENGSVGHDHAVLRPMMLTMTVGISDNPFRALRAQAGEAGGPITGNLLGTAAGAGISKLSQDIAVAAGLASSVANAAFAAGQATTRSESALEEIRLKQRRRELLTVVDSGGKIYENVIITRTSRTRTKENEGGMILLVEMMEMLTVSSIDVGQAVPVTNQAQGTLDYGIIA